MERRDFLRISALGLGSLAVSPRWLTSAPRRPNFLLILIDDLGWNNVGFMGSRFYETPNLDRLARDSVVFTNAYANAPNCAPTRACLLTGQYTPRHGIYTVGNSARGKARFRKLIPVPNRTVLPRSEVTLAEALKPAGYVSASIGKWHLGRDPESGPVSQGFDLNVGGYDKGHPVSYFSPYHNPFLSDGPEGEYLTDRLTDEAITFLRKNRSRPFFLYFPTYAVHTPLQAPAELVAKYRRKKPDGGQANPAHGAMMENVDWNVGRLLNALDDLGLAKNTVTFFLSDNGGVKGITSMAPLRGGKGMLYEGGIRIPAFIHWPGVTDGGRECSEPILGMDVYPTILEMAGVAPPRKHVIDGVSLVPLLRGERTLRREAIFWHFPAYLQAAFDMSEARDPYFRTRPCSVIRAGDWKLIEYFEDDALELYNLSEDIGEKTNLAAKLPGKTRELHERLVAWRREIGAPIPTQRNPTYRP